VAGADLAFALQLADLADSLSLPRFRADDLRVETKPDLTPVTDADRTVERALREQIALERPGEGVLGEEEGDDGGPRNAAGGPSLRPGGGGSAVGAPSHVRWVVDPIDGTRNFSRGLPVWATLIALERESMLTAAVVSAPALGRRWWASRGGGAFADGEPIGVSRVAALQDASVSCSLARDLARIEPVAWHARGLGDFWQHVLVAEGALDAAVDTKLELWDSAAVELVVTEAGGRAGIASDGQFVTTNGFVHDELLALLRDR
jgi:histidinol-phosphatase